MSSSLVDFATQPEAEGLVSFSAPADDGALGNSRFKSRPGSYLLAARGGANFVRCHEHPEAGTTRQKEATRSAEAAL
jgi:hypothetical protein